MLLTDIERKTIAIIATDIASGRHLLRDAKQWNEFEKNHGVSLKDYDEMYKTICRISNFNMIDETDLTTKENEIFLYYKCCQDHNFEQVLKNFKSNI